MHIDQAFPSNFIKASDLQGREVLVVISSADIEEIGKGGDRKLVLKFQGKQKGMICNRTNANRIAHSYGNDTDEWVGKEIVLYPDLVDFQGKSVEAIRVKAPQRRAPVKPVGNHQVQKRDGYELSTAAPAPVDNTGALDDEIPF